MTTAAPRSAATPHYPGLDVLRFLCALGVLVYHMLYWNRGIEFRVWGIYFVCIFFAISGASIHAGYAGRVGDAAGLRRFMLARFTRLLPLFLLVLAAQTTFYALARNEGLGPLLQRALVNATLLFGLGAPGATSIVIGGWSLGVEVVFYALFPLVVALFGSRLLWPCLVLLVVQCAQVSQLLKADELGAAAWPLFCNPLSFVFFFVAGCWVSVQLAHAQGRPSAAWAAASVLLLAGIAAAGVWGGQRPLVFGVAGIVMPLASTALVYAWGRVTLPPGPIAAAAALLGSASYGVYLLHPLVYGALKRGAFDRDTPLAAVIAAVAVPTLVAALVLDRWFEKPVRQWLQGRLAGARAPAAPAGDAHARV